MRCVGDVVDVVVETLQPFGVHANLDGGHGAFIEPQHLFDSVPDSRVPPKAPPVRAKLRAIIIAVTGHEQYGLSLRREDFARFGHADRWQDWTKALQLTRAPDDPRRSQLPSNRFSASDVLDQLDDDAYLEPAFFPDFDNGSSYHVDARLTAYADETRWAIVIEQLHVSPRSSSFAGAGTCLCFHGNCVDLSADPHAGENNMITLADLLDPGPGGPLLPDTYSEEIFLTAKNVRVRGQVVPISTEESYYRARGIEGNTLTHEHIEEWIKQARKCLPPKEAEEKVRFYETEVRPDVGRFKIYTWDLLRGMVPEYRELLLATEAERRRGIPRDLPLLLQTDSWDHPHLLEGQKPSASKALRQIAEVLATRDYTLWKFDPREGNVHWRNWPFSGSL